jgi:hypothetical protein
VNTGKIYFFVDFSLFATIKKGVCVTSVIPLTFAKIRLLKRLSKFLLSFLRFWDDLEVCLKSILFLAKKRKKYLTGCEKKRYIRVRTALIGHNFKKEREL